VVVQHDMRVIADSDCAIDIGPGAGEEGGRIVAAGLPAGLAPTPESRTAPTSTAPSTTTAHVTCR
jgi:excinuclease ABC subunit A